MRWIAEKKCKIKRVGALSRDCKKRLEGQWRVDCTKYAKLRGCMRIKRVGALRGRLRKKCKIKRVGALRGGWRMDCKKSAKLRGLGY